jgi:lipopolysaccharide transport system permease protein
MWVRDLHQRYRQSWLGSLWIVLTPVAMLAVYTLVFRHVMRVKWPGIGESNLEFALRIYAGLAIFLFFAECVNRAPGLILEQPNLVKKVVFPLHVLPWVSLATASVGLGVAAVLLILLSVVSGQGLHVTSLMLPFAWLALFPWVLGLSWFLAALGVFVRDVGQVLGLLVSALMFLSPVFFPVEALPKGAQELLALNPLAPVMTATRDLISGLPVQWLSLVVVFLTGLFVALASLWFFRRVRPGFADVL